jgi:hypothetical protein
MRQLLLTDGNFETRKTNDNTAPALDKSNL